LAVLDIHTWKAQCAFNASLEVSHHEGIQTRELHVILCHGKDLRDPFDPAYLQVIVESRQECQEAQRLIGLIRSAYPEVLTAIKTKQLAQEMLLYKEDHIDDVARTGDSRRALGSCFG
jgi:hypothetical protein